jgi:hypothetical protein
MKANKLILLAVVAAILGVAAYMSSRSVNVKTPSQVGRELLPELDLSKVMKIELKCSDNENLLLSGGDDGWKINSLYDYPADITKIRERLLTLKSLKIGQKSSPEKIADADILDLQDSSGKSLTTLLIGDEHMRKATGRAAQFGGSSYPDGRYVSTGDKDEVWLVKETLSSFTPKPSNWADTQIISISSSDVNGIALMKQGESCILSKKDGEWSVAGLKDDEEFDTSASHSLESALSSLSFNNLADPALSDDDLGISTGAVFKVTIKSGESYTASLGSVVPDGTDRYMKIRANFTPQGTNETVNAEIRTKVENFNEKSSRWSYIIPSYKADSMMKSRADIVKKKEKQPEPEASEKEQPQTVSAAQTSERQTEDEEGNN